MVRHLLFDLDGTLLDTTRDIVDAMNEALERCGFPYRYDRKSINYLIGDGADECIRRALQDRRDDPQAFAALKPVYMELYRAYQARNAAPFPGLKETLIRLKNAGMGLSVVTNKPDVLSTVVVEKNYGPGFFDCILGQSDAFPRKPDPAMVDEVIRRCGYYRDNCIYVGDSHVDIATGHNAGLPVALCLWGYETDYDSWKNKAVYLLQKPEDLLRFLK